MSCINPPAPTADTARGLNADSRRATAAISLGSTPCVCPASVKSADRYAGTGKEFSDDLHNIEERNLPFYTYGGRLSFPLSNTSARNNYKSGKAALEQTVLTLKKLEQTVMIQIDNDIGTLRANFDQVHATRTAREYEESALDAEQKKLESGKSTTYTVLQVQRDLTNARGAEIQALDAYNKTLSQLSLDEGSTLNRLGINFEVK